MAPGSQVGGSSSSSASSRAAGAADTATATILLKALNAAACGTGQQSLGPLAAAAEDVARAGAGSAGPAALPRILAYGAASSGALSSSSSALAAGASSSNSSAWSSLLEAAEADLGAGSAAPWDVRAAALAALLCLPEELAAEALGAGGAGNSAVGGGLGALGRAPAVLSADNDDDFDDEDDDADEGYRDNNLGFPGAPRASTAARCLAARACGAPPRPRGATQ